MMLSMMEIIFMNLGLQVFSLSINLSTCVANRNLCIFSISRLQIKKIVRTVYHGFLKAMAGSFKVLLCLANSLKLRYVLFTIIWGKGKFQLCITCNVTVTDQILTHYSHLLLRVTDSNPAVKGENMICRGAVTWLVNHSCAVLSSFRSASGLSAFRTSFCKYESYFCFQEPNPWNSDQQAEWLRCVRRSS